MSSPKVIVDATPVVKVSYGLPGPGIPKGGVFPKVLKKSSSTDYDAEWGEPYQVYLDVEGGQVASGLDVIGKVLFIAYSTPQGNPVFEASTASSSNTLPPAGIFAGGTAAQPEIITHGVLYGVNTIGFGIGDRLYVGTLGALTSTPPSENAFHVATVLKVSSSGSIFVNISNVDSSFEGLALNKIWVGNSSGVATQVDAVLTSLTDVSSSMSPSNGEILRYQSGEWNSSSLTLSDTGLAQLTEGHVYVGDSNNLTSTTDTLYVDAANSRVGIGTTTPADTLDVVGRLRVEYTAGQHNIFIGRQAGNDVTSGSSAVFIGRRAGQKLTAVSSQTYIGYDAGRYSSGADNVGVGRMALNGASLAASTGTRNTAVGRSSISRITGGNDNTAVGYLSLETLTSGSNNVAVGSGAGSDQTIGSESTYVGASSGRYLTGGSNVAIGYEAAKGILGFTASSEVVAIGHQAMANIIGSQVGNTAVGYQALRNLGNGQKNTSLGWKANDGIATQSSTTAIGYDTSASENATVVGADSFASVDGVAVGNLAFSGAHAVSIGYSARAEADTVSVGHGAIARQESVAVGYLAGELLSTSSQGGNTLVGHQAGQGTSSSSSDHYNNTAIGWNAGRLLDSGNGNVLIGYAAGQSLTDESNQLHINNSIASSGAPLIYGEFDNQYVKINGSLEVTSSGKIGTTLEVVGDIISTNDEDITLMPDGLGHVVMGNYEFDVDQPVGQNTDDYILAYDDSDGTIRLKENIIEVTGATSVTTPIRNNETVVIPAGTPVYAMGEAQGGVRTLVGIADASNPAKMPAIGIAATDLQPTGTDEDGDAIVMGDFDVTISPPYSGLEPNDILYVAVGGGLPTQTKPTGASNLIQNIGVVLKTNGASGTQCKALKVSCIGRSNDLPNLADGLAWVGNTSGVATPTALADVALTGDYTDLTNTPTDEHIGNTNLTIVGGDRILDQDSNSFKIQGDDSSGSLVTMLNSAPNPGASQDPTLSLVGNSVVLTPNVGLFTQGCNFGLGLSTGTGAFNSPGGSVSFNSTAVTAGGPSYGTTIRATQGMTGNVQYSLPSTYPSAANQVLSSTTAGDMSWVDQSGGDNIGNSDLTLSDNRILDLDSYNLVFEKNGVAVLGWANSLDTWAFTGSDVAIFGNFDTVGDTSHAGRFVLKGQTTSASGRIALNDADDSNRVEITVPSVVPSNITFVLPSNTGNANDALITDGAGNLSWAAQSGGLSAVQDDTAPTLGGDLDVYDGTLTHSITTSNTNGDILIQPNGTGNVFLGDLEFDSDQGIGSNLDNYVLTFDAATRLVSLEPPQGGLTITGTPSAAEVPFVDSSGNNLETDPDFSYASATGSLSIEALSSGKIQQFQPVAPQGQQLAPGSFGRNSEVVAKLGTTAAVTAGIPYSLNGSWTPTDAGVEAKATKLLGVASGTGSTQGTPIVLKGMVKLASGSTDTTFASASVGDPVYLKDAGGSQQGTGIVTCTAPSSQGEYVRVVGYVVNPSSDIMYFDPDNTWIEL